MDKPGDETGTKLVLRNNTGVRVCY